MILIRLYSLSLVVWILASQLALAQLDFGKKLALEAYGADESGLAAQPGELQWGRIKFDYNRPWQDVPFDPTREWGLFWGLEADYTLFDFSGSVEGFDDLDLVRIRLPWQLVYKPGGMRSDWTFAAMLAPGIASDLEGFEFEDLTLDALLLGFYRLNKQWEVGAGVYFSNSLALPFPVPGVGVNWTPHEDFSLRLFPPIASATWQMSEHWTSQLYFRPAGGLWNLHGDRPERVERFKLSAWMAGLGVEHEFAQGSRLQLSAGYLFGQRVEFVDNDDDKILGSDFDPAPFVRVGYQWDF